VGFADREAVDDVFLVLLHGAHRGYSAIRDARGDHDGVRFGDLHATGGELLVEHRKRELDRPKYVVAPRFFRIEFRVRVLEGKSIRGRSIEGGTVTVGQTRREIRVIARGGGIGALAADQIHGVVLQVIVAGAGALGGIGDGEAVLETPLTGRRNGTIDTARAGRRCGNDATVRRIKSVRYLHHHGDVGAPIAGFLEDEVFVARNEPFAAGDGAVRRHVGP